MRKSPETFTQLCDSLIVDPSYKMAARDLRVSEQTIFRWLQESQANPTAFTFAWGDDGGVAPLHIHVRSAMKMNAHLIESQARKMSLDGWDEPIFFQGKQWYVESEEKAGGDLDWCEMVDGHRDYYKRDANGDRIPLMAKRKPSDALVLAVLKAYMPKAYGTNVEHNVNHSGGVLVIGAQRGVKPVNAEPKALPTPAEDRLAAIRKRMMDEAEAHLSNPDRVTHPNAPVQKFAGGPDSEIHDAAPVVSRAQPRPAQPSQPPKTAQPYAPPYARTSAPGNGVQGTGVGPDPSNVGGSRGFNMHPPARNGSRRTP